MKKLLRIMIFIPLCGLLVVLGASLALSLYYSKNFPVNTWINGVYCTGKTLEEVNRELADRTPVPDITLIGAAGEQTTLSLAEADGQADYRQALKNYLQKHASYLWMRNLDTPVQAAVEEVQYSWNTEKLRNQFSELSFVQENNGREKGVSIELTEDGYVLQDGNSNLLDTDRAFEYMEKCLKAGKTTISLQEGGCYDTLEDSSADKAARLCFQQLEELFSCNLVYDMGAEKIPLTADILSHFVMLEEGQILLKEEGIRDWVAELATQYDTKNTTRTFQATRGESVEVPYVTYGTCLNQEKEVKWLLENFWENRQVRSEPEYHIPSYSQEPFYRGLDDIGPTYIEIDMTTQHMYYYQEGELKLDTDIVTGNMARKMGTPEGINYVYNKQRNRVLRGPGYASPVKYWMPVKGGIGIHDASWRKEFGGEIYKKSGSHGCINTPTDVMSTLYDMVEVGTPVVMFY